VAKFIFGHQLRLAAAGIPFSQRQFGAMLQALATRSQNLSTLTDCSYQLELHM
jgi:hypothetical protein